MAEKKTTNPRAVLSDYFDTHEVPREVADAWKMLDKTVESLAQQLATGVARLTGST